MTRGRWMLVLPMALAGCGYVDAYEEAVYDWEPAYCYQSLAGVTCFREPYHRDDDRLVNYFGPHPSRHDPPDPPELAPLQVPPAVNYWVKDPEPIPRPAPKAAHAAELPWLARPLAPTPLPPEAAPKSVASEQDETPPLEE